MLATGFHMRRSLDLSVTVARLRSAKCQSVKLSVRFEERLIGSDVEICLGCSIAHPDVENRRRSRSGNMRAFGDASVSSASFVEDHNSINVPMS
jgi:hypothetical protein